MYRWHVHSAIGRGRPYTNDLARVTDGIVASLRQFSISVARSADEEQRDGPRISRTRSTSRAQRSADAFKEVSSLAPTTSRGIDARSLAAKPPSAPTSFRIIRDGDTSGTGDGTNIVTRSGFAPRAAGGPRVGGRGGSGPRRDGAGRGGAAGRGRDGKPRMSQKDKREQRKKEKKELADGDEYGPEQFTPEEAAYLDMSEGGLPTNYQPETSATSLARYGPAVMSSPRGVHESVVHRIMVATDNKDPSFDHASMHLARMDEGLGTFFEDAEQKASAQEYHGGRKFRSLTDEQKSTIMREWVAGRYQKLKAPGEGNVLARTRQLARRNETYLPEDRIKFDQTLRSLLPKSMQEAVWQPIPPPPQLVGAYAHPRRPRDSESHKAGDSPAPIIPKAFTKTPTTQKSTVPA